tara:strand:+ start:909 stop:2285 length:1377 start_codon:yes stop_codon:yes gene_type:complete
MKVRKISQNKSEIDFSELIKKWWYHRKLVIFSTIIFALITSIILILSQNILVNKSQKYIGAILKSDFGDKNDPIISAFKSPKLINEAMNSVLIDVNVKDISNALQIVNSRDPLSKSLQDKIYSLTNKDIKRLSLSNDNLISINNALDDNSKDLLTIKFYYQKLDLSSQEAIDFIIKFSEIVNNHLLLTTVREKSSDLSSISVFDYKHIDSDGVLEKMMQYIDILDNIKRSIFILNNKYRQLLSNFDLEALKSETNITQIYLFELSKNLQISYPFDTLDISINKKERDIEDLKTSLEFIQNEKSQINSENRNISDEKSINTTSLNSEVLDRILSIGSQLNNNVFRLKTLTKIQEVQSQKSDLLAQKELIELPSQFSQEDLDIEKIGKSIFIISGEINKAIEQVRELVRPNSIIQFTSNPSIFDSNLKDMKDYIKINLALAVIAFFCISIIALLLPNRNN